MNLGIVKIQKNSRIMDEVAELYCGIFKEPPWNEKFVPKQVVEVMKEQIKRPRAIALAALKNNEVVGFAWMYELFKDDLKEGTRYSPELGFLFKNQKKVFYLQEIGVKKEMRRQGIGRELTQELLLRGRKNGANVIVLSTNGEAKSIILLISKIGFQNSKIVRSPKELRRTYWVLKLED